MRPDRHDQRAMQRSQPGSAALSPFRQLRWQILVIFVLLAILPLLIVEGITLPRMMKQAEDQVFAQLDSVAELKYDQIIAWMSASNTALDLLLSPPVYRELRQFLKAVEPTDQQQLRIDEVLLVTAKRVDEDSLHGEAGVEQLFSEYFVYTPDGRIVAASDPVQKGKVVALTPYFPASLEANKVHPPFYTLGRDSFDIFFTRRIIDDQGKILGVLAAHSNPELLNEMMLQRTGMGDSGETYLVSKESNYLLTPSRFDDYPLIHSYRSLGIDEGLNGKNGRNVYLNYERSPQMVLGSYRWLSELQTALVAEVKEAEALDAIVAVKNISIVAALGVGILAALLGLFFAARISAPITRLTQAATRIAEGDLDQQATVKASNEIGVLAKSFSSMATQIKQMVEELEQRVAARTSDLRQALDQREQTVAELQESISIRDQLSTTIRDLSSPVLPISDGVIVVPLIGAIDSQRARLLMEEVLSSIETYRARIVIIDVTGVPVIDTQVAQALLQTASAARMLGAQPMLVGIRPEIAQTLVSLGLNLDLLETHADLREAIVVALKKV